jgi:hypothetical protein
VATLDMAPVVALAMAPTVALVTPRLLVQHLSTLAATQEVAEGVAPELPALDMSLKVAPEAALEALLGAPAIELVVTPVDTGFLQLEMEMVVTLAGTLMIVFILEQLVALPEALLLAPGMTLSMEKIMTLVVVTAPPSLGLILAVPLATTPVAAHLVTLGTALFKARALAVPIMA